MNSQSPDYATLIDAQTWRFIERTEQWYPPGTTDLSVDEQRSIYDAMCREFHAGYPSGVSAADDHRAVATRHYQCANRRDRVNAKAQVVYLHGGGFVVGGLHSHDDVCAELCSDTGLDVIAVEYRLCPEHKHPAAFDDAVTAIHKIWRMNPLPMILCGDSAGGNLAAAAAHYLRGSAEILAGQVLIYPGLGGDTTAGSYVTHANAPLLTTREVQYYSALRANGDIDAADPTQAPLQDTDFSALPPTLIISAQCDPLSDDGRHYRDRIVKAGGLAVWFNEAGLVHGYLRARKSCTRAELSFKRIVSAITCLAEGRWPYASGH